MTSAQFALTAGVGIGPMIVLAVVTWWKDRPLNRWLRSPIGTSFDEANRKRL